MTKRTKRIIGGIVLLVVIWFLYGAYQQKKDFKFSHELPEFAVVERGDLEVPISATGTVAPETHTEIKCKASGTVKKVFFEAGDMVRHSDLLVELDPIDEQRMVDNAEAEVARTKASLILARAEADKASRDWPMQIETALANLEAIRASLQGGMVNFKRIDFIRQGEGPHNAKISYVDPAAIQPIALEPKESLLVARAAKEIALATIENDEASQLVQYGKSVINNPEAGWRNLPVSEYQDMLINMWQTQARLMAAIADVHNAVNMQILVDSAETKVALTEEALKMAEVALEQAEQRLTDTKVYAPRDGLILQLFVQEGQIISSGITTVTGGTPLMILADVENFYIEADVDEADIGRVRELAPLERSARLYFNPEANTAHSTSTEQEDIELLRGADNVQITVDAFREEEYTGRVDRVYPNPKNIQNIITYKVRILLTSENRSNLMLGMHANVRFTSRKISDALLVPIEAIRSLHEEHGVYIKGEDGKPLFVPITVGLTDSLKIEIKTDKLKEGQQVYTKLPIAREN